jgi:hypothetical protein
MGPPAEDRNQDSTPATPSSGNIASKFSKIKRFFTDAPKMPSNRTAAVAYGDKLKDPAYNPGHYAGSSQTTAGDLERAQVPGPETERP